MRKLPPLKALQSFESSSRLGSMMRAAEEMGLTPSAVSHQIRGLEDILGLRLFYRSHRSIVLTDAGRRYAGEIADAFGRIEAATRSILRSGRSEVLTIHVEPCLAAQWLMPRISRFSMGFPDIDVRLVASDEGVELANGAADFHLRYGLAMPEAGTQVEAFPDETIVPLCAPRLLDGPDGMRQPGDLSRYPLIHTEANLFGWRDWLRLQGRAIDIDLDRGPRFDRPFMALSAAMDGCGVCLESTLLIQRELDSGRLVMPFGAIGPRIQCHCIAYSLAKAQSPKLRSFRDWLFKALAEG